MERFSTEGSFERMTWLAFCENGNGATQSTRWSWGIEQGWTPPAGIWRSSCQAFPFLLSGRKTLHFLPDAGTLPTIRHVGGGGCCRCPCRCRPNRTMITRRSLFWRGSLRPEDKYGKTWSRSKRCVRSGEDFGGERSIVIWTIVQSVTYRSKPRHPGGGRGAPIRIIRRCQTEGGSEPTAIVAAERKHGNSSARGLAGGSCPAPCVVQGDYQLKGVTSR